MTSRLSHIVDLLRFRLHPKPRDAGYTLLELAAVIAIVIIASAVVISGAQSIQSASVTTATARLAASVRYLHDLSVLNNRPYRLIIDMSSHSYWGELVDSPDGCGAALLASEEEIMFGEKDNRRGTGATASDPAGATGAGPTDAEKNTGDEQGDGDEVRKIRRKDNLLTRKQLPKGIEFDGVMTSHQNEVTEEAQGEIFFFPAGYVEKAYIYVTRDDDVYTIETIPLKGIAVVHSEELDPRDLLDRG